MDSEYLTQCLTCNQDKERKKPLGHPFRRGHLGGGTPAASQDHAI